MSQVKALFGAGALASARALRRMLAPIIAVQISAFLLVISYYLSLSVRSASGGLAKLSTEGGLIFAALSTVFASTVLPRLFQAVVRWKGVRSRGTDLAFEICYFAFVGMIINLFYRLQSMLFGDALRVEVVVSKVALDMLLFTPLFNLPVAALLFLWRDKGFDLRETAAAIRSGALLPRIGAFVVGAWGFWLPMLGAIYALPHDLQFCLFLLAQAAWSLLLVAMDRDERETTVSAG